MNLANRRSYAILGTGAIGGYYGGRLAKAGFPVHFLAKSDYKEIKNQGLMVRSVEGDFHLPQVHVSQNFKALPKCDVIVVSWKTISNGFLEEVLPSIAKPETVVLMLQNGLDPEAQAQKVLPNHTVFGGLCFICSTKTGPGEIEHLDYGAVRIGQHKPVLQKNHTTLPQLVEDFHAAGIQATAEDDLRKARWEKLVWNIPFNGLAALLKSNTHQLMSHIYSQTLVKSLMTEVAQVSKSDGYPVSANFMEKMIANTQSMKPYRPSMLLDRLQQRPMELESIYQEPIAIARDNGLDLPQMEFLMNSLYFLQTQYLSQSKR